MDPSGDLEKKFDLEISPMCNQQADSVPAIQTGECVCRIKEPNPKRRVPPAHPTVPPG